MIDKPLGQDVIDGQVVKWEPGQLDSEYMYRTSLPDATPEERLHLYAIAESECTPAIEMINREFLVSDFYCHGCMLNGRVPGELVPAVRTILFGPGQKPIQFVAKSAWEFVKRTANFQAGEPAWKPPLKVLLKQVPCKGGHTYKFVVQNGKKAK